MLSGHYPRGRWPLFFSIFVCLEYEFYAKRNSEYVKPRNLTLWVRQDNAM